MLNLVFNEKDLLTFNIKGNVLTIIDECVFQNKCRVGSNLYLYSKQYGIHCYMILENICKFLFYINKGIL